MSRFLHKFAALVIAVVSTCHTTSVALAASNVLNIVAGGTYTGQWESDNPAVPVVTINTTEPVVIENSTLRGRGNLIQTAVAHTRVTVRNVHGTGLNPNVADRPQGRFFTGESFDSIVIQNNDLEQTAGIYLLTYAGSGKADVTVRIVANRAHNIDGRLSDGAGGVRNQTDEVQFVQLDQVQHVPHVEIAWNQVVNEPGASGVEDVINIYRSSGTPQSPIRIHDNYIDGAYPADPASADYSGGGIMLGDGNADGPEGLSAYVVAFDNQVINTTNYGIAVAAGFACTMHHNRILSTGALPDGTPLPAQNVGAYIWDSNKSKAKRPNTFSNNSGYANRIGWMKNGARNDWWVPDAARWRDNVRWPGPITVQTLAAERARWEKKLKQQTVTVGPQ